MSQIDWSKAPEGATHFHPGNAKYSPHWVKKGYFCVTDFEHKGWVREVAGTPLDECVVRPTTPQWNGTGRPPAGTVCEFREYCGTWAECTIIGEFKGRIICGCNATGTVGYIDLEELRQIRTPEQIAADEREAAIEEMYQIYKNSPGLATQQGMAALYDHGYRKQSTCDPTGYDD